MTAQSRILIDTSAWIDYLRGSPTMAASAVRQALLADETEVVMCEPIAMELLAGVSDATRNTRLERLVNGLAHVALDPWMDFRQAASIYRSVRNGGLMVRSLTDCLIASVALNHRVPVLHKDRDYASIAEFTDLQAISVT